MTSQPHSETPETEDALVKVDCIIHGQPDQRRVIMPKFARAMERQRDALRAELTAALAKQAWRPIETAPKDGTVIDLWIGNRKGLPGRRSENCYWGKPDHECGEAGEYCDSDWHGANPGWVDSTFGEFLGEKPTHWQPLPEPPEEKV